jgi:hypothetical protein
MQSRPSRLSGTTFLNCKGTLFFGKTDEKGSLQSATTAMRRTLFMWTILCAIPHLLRATFLTIEAQTRNFALNPGEGLKIHAFRNAHTPEAKADCELKKLTRYMVHIASVDDFRTLKHHVSRYHCSPAQY